MSLISTGSILLDSTFQNVYGSWFKPLLRHWELLFACLLLQMFLEMLVLLGRFCVFAVAGLLLLLLASVPATGKLLVLASLSACSLRPCICCFPCCCLWPCSWSFLCCCWCFFFKISAITFFQILYVSYLQAQLLLLQTIYNNINIK